MFGRSFKLFRVMGFTVRADISWLLIAVLITWSLAVGLFPNYYPPEKYPQMTAGYYWLMGLAGAVGLFGSIVFHELCHSLTARRFGTQMKGITLFIFGGVAEMAEEPKNARAEFWTAIFGPIASIAVAIVSYLIYLAGRAGAWPIFIQGVFGYLGFINILLVMFNLIPGFPLDGGRVLRSVLWYAKGDLRWATRVAARIGSGFGLLLIFLGVFWFFRNPVGGIWWLLIGLFLRNAARQSYQQLVIRQALEGEKVRQFMNEHPVTVPPDLPVSRMVEEYVYRYHHKMYPVTEDGHLRGCIGIEEIRALPREEWPRRQVAELTRPCTLDNTIDADADAVEALSRMSRTQSSNLMVTEGERLAGIISLKDLLKFLAIKVELENGGARGLKLPLL